MVVGLLTKVAPTFCTALSSGWERTINGPVHHEMSIHITTAMGKMTVTTTTIIIRSV